MSVEDLRARLAELADTPEPATASGRNRVRQIATRRRRRRRRGLTLACAVALLVVGGLALATVTSSGTSRPHVIVPAQTPQRELLRPVLAECAPTTVMEQTFTTYGPAGSTNEVFASPVGIAGPIAVFHTEPVIEASTPGVPPLDPNITIASIPAHYSRLPTTGESMLTWYKTSTVLATIDAIDLQQSDMELLAESLITHGGALPARLASLGPVGTRTVSRATCVTLDGTMRTLAAIHGSPASRYAEAFQSGSNAWDEGNTTLIASVIAPPGSPAPPPQPRPAVREATPEEWETLMHPPASSGPPTPPPTIR